MTPKFEAPEPVAVETESAAPPEEIVDHDAIEAERNRAEAEKAAFAEIAAKRQEEVALALALVKQQSEAALAKQQSDTAAAELGDKQVRHISEFGDKNYTGHPDDLI